MKRTANEPHVVRTGPGTRFADAVARAMAMGGGDVVVLDSRAQPAHGWLEKMSRCAASDPRIATVAAWPPFAGDPARVERAIELAAVPLYPDVAAANDECLYIRRQALQDVGSFASSAELRRRASEAGYRNVLCDDAFVAGCPDAMLDAESLAPLRAMVRSQLAVLGAGDKPGVLHVVHPRGGGTEKYIQELIAATRGDYRHYFLRIHPDRWRLAETEGAEPGAYEWPRDEACESGAWLRSICAWLRIGVAHVHSLVGSGEEFVRVLERSSVPYCYSVHDMYLPCPTVYLIDSAGVYCNATTDPVLCTRCLAKFPGLEGTDIVAWRARYARFLGKAQKVYAPSRWAAETLAKYYPGAAVTVAPPRVEPAGAGAHESASAFSLPDDGRRTIGVLGAIGPEKGARLVEAMVTRIRERSLPLRVVVVGYTDVESRHQSADGVLTVHGPYGRDEIAALLDHYGIAILAFPTIWPETFSYTLSEGWQAGRPALVPPRGALRERVLATGAGWLMDGFPEVDAMLDQMAALTAPSNRPEVEAKSRLAKAVAESGGEPAARLYRDLAVVSQDAALEVPRYPIYEAACRAMGVQALPQPAIETAPREARRRTPLERLVRLLRD